MPTRWSCKAVTGRWSTKPSIRSCDAYPSAIVESRFSRCVGDVRLEVTFVFPFSFTENQRSLFHRELVAPNRRIQVRAWRLEDLRELLDRHRDVRETELDAPLRALLGGANITDVLDHAHAGDDLLAAAATGPLEHLGLQTGFDAAAY